MATSTNDQASGNSSIFSSGNSLLSGLGSLADQYFGYQINKQKIAAGSLNLAQNAANSNTSQNTPAAQSNTNASPSDPLQKASAAVNPQNIAAGQNAMAAYKPYLIAGGAILAILAVVYVSKG